MLATIQELCVICRRLLLISDTMLKELRKLGFDSKAAERLERDLNHIRDMLRKMED